MLVKISENLSVPAEILADMGIHPGDKVEVTMHEGGVFIRPIALLSKSKFEKINNIVNIDVLKNNKRPSMRSNAAFRSFLRQPVRLLMFMLLVGLATFGFVSRVVEFDILNREINRVSRFYRATGALVPVDPLSTNNVYAAAALLQNSPLISHHDRRTITQAVMHGQANGMRGFHTLGGNLFQRGEQPFSYKELYPFDTFVVVEVVSAIRRTLYLRHLPEPIRTNRVTFQPINILAGHNQFIMGNRRLMTDFYIDENEISIADHLQVGGRYMLRGTIQSPTCNTLEVFPLLEGLYFVDFSDRDKVQYVWSQLENELRILMENTNMLMLTGTMDMTALPMVQSGTMERGSGRFFTQDDYDNRNHVMVVPRTMTHMVGETITLTLRDMHTFENGSPFPPAGDLMLERLPHGVAGHWANIPAGYWVQIPRDYTGLWRTYPTHEIEVTVIGAYHIPFAHDQPRWAHINQSFRNMEAFVPASIIPEGFGIVDAHMVSGQYSFVLENPLGQAAFNTRYGQALLEMGFVTQFTGEDAHNFWLSITPIRNAIRLNLFLFSILLVVVLASTVLAYLRQRLRDFAIQRALGIADGNATRHLLVPVFVFWLPVVFAAAAGAWFFAMAQAGSGMDVLAELDVPDAAETIVHMNILQQMRLEEELAAMPVPPLFALLHLALICIAVAVGWVVAVLAGVRFFAAKSMILLLQTAQGAGAVRNIRDEGTTAVRVVSRTHLHMILRRSKWCALLSVLRHHTRHTLRAPVKSALLLCVALMFVVSLGWLDATITFSQNEIERLHSTTTIAGTVVAADARPDDERLQGHDIPRQGLYALLESGFVTDVYYTSVQLHIGLFPPIDPSTVLDHSVFSRAGLMPAPPPATNIIKGISCWDRFVYESSRPVAFGMGDGNDFAVTFAPGYSANAFVTVWPYVTATPVIVHESLLERDLMVYNRGITPFSPTRMGNIIEQRLQLGDYAYLGHATDPNVYRVKIIGTYTGGHPRSAYVAGHGLVLHMSDPLISEHISYISFNIIQEMVPYIAYFQYEMEEKLQIVRHTWHGSVTYHHIAVLNDMELRQVIAPLEDNLHLLSMLYPVVRALGFVIGVVLCLLLMLQNTKNAAILWILGKPRYKTRLGLCIEQLAICCVGLVVAFVLVLIMGVGLQVAVGIVALYFAGALLGNVVGTIAITLRTPMELLQMRE